MKKVLLFCPQMSNLAQCISAVNKNVSLGEITWDHFPDSFPNIRIENVPQDVRGCDVTFLASFDTPQALFEQFGVIYALPRFGAGSLRIILPYYPTATMERVQQEGEIATAMTLARMLSIVPHTRPGGSPEIVIFDIHALSERFYFSDNIIPRLESAIPLLKARLTYRRRKNGEEFVIAFPDDGAYKRFGDQFNDYAQIMCAKVRDGEKREITIIEGDPEGKHVVIVDDLIQTGGTIHECRNELIKSGAQKVSAYATHGVFPHESWRTFTEDLFDRVWITDSCPQIAEAVEGHEPFEVISLMHVIADIL